MALEYFEGDRIFSECFNRLLVTFIRHFEYKKTVIEYQCTLAKEKYTLRDTKVRKCVFLRVPAHTLDNMFDKNYTTFVFQRITHSFIPLNPCVISKHW